jgi:hypothetical protein
VIQIRKPLTISLGLLATGTTVLAQTVPSGAVPRVARAGVPTVATAQRVQQGGNTFGPGNLILNGDFETYSGGTCDSNLPNVSFTAMMASATGFGTAEEIDVYTNPPCYGLPAVSGAIKVAIHRQDLSFGGFSDAFSLDLSSPVTAGNSYTVSFWAESDGSFSTGLGHVQIGVSSSASTFGSLVYTGVSTTLDTWEQFTATFVAPITGSYLTVNQDEVNAWSHIDAFTLTDSGIGTKYCTANANSTGSPADLSASGSASSGAGNLTLTSAPVPNQNSIFFHGMSQTQVPFGNGFLCTTGNIVRGAVVMGAGNVATYTYDNSNAQHSLAAFVGTTRNFQHWFRDPMGGGAFFNLSNAISIAIAP